MSIPIIQLLAVVYNFFVFSPQFITTELFVQVSDRLWRELGFTLVFLFSHSDNLDNLDWNKILKNIVE